MDTIRDAQQALWQDLPKQYLKRPHWREAGWAIVKAGDTGARSDIMAATELLVAAADAEGWMSHDRV